MAKIFAFCNKKGGVAKTTSALAIGAGLMKRGKKVLFVDLDSQCNLSNTLQTEKSVANILNLLTLKISADKAVQQTKRGEIIPAVESLNAIDAVLNQTGKEFRLKETLESIVPNYDFILLDTPPSLEVLTINALTAADEVIIPTQADMYSYEGIKQLWQAIATNRKYCNRDLKVAGILIVRYNNRTNINKTIKADLMKMAAAFNTKVFTTEIRECVALRESQLLHEDIYSYAPTCNAVKDYDAIIDELEAK